MNMAVIVLSALLLLQGADDKKAEDLIRDLGAEEYSVREKAESDLRKIGDAAIPALRKALEDKDPERAQRAHRLLAGMEKKGPQSDQDRHTPPERWMAFRDFGRGITFETHPDGKVELTVREGEPGSGKKETHTYKADSLEDFKKKYPELAAKYDLEHLAPKEQWNFFEDSQDFWDSWKKRFDKDWFWDKDAMGKFALPWFPFGSDSLDHWVQDQKKQFDAFRKLEPPAPDGGSKEGVRKAELGIAVERVDSAVAEQLGLVAGEGLVIAEVKPSSHAERAGLRKHDILLKVNGKALIGPEELRRDVEAGLKNGMELEIVRRGKHESVKVEPGAFSTK